MTDFTKILDKAKELEAKMKESQENIKKINELQERMKWIILFLFTITGTSQDLLTSLTR